MDGQSQQESEVIVSLCVFALVSVLATRTVGGWDGAGFCPVTQDASERGLAQTAGRIGRMLSGRCRSHGSSACISPA